MPVSPRNKRRLSAGAIALLLSFASHAAPERVDALIRTALELDPNVKNGRALYQEHCSSCHGQKALGSATKLIPALAGQRQAYLIKQLADFAELERQATEMHRVVARAQINEPQAWTDLAAYLNNLEPTPFPQRGKGANLELGEAQYAQWCASCHGDDGRGDEDGFSPSLRNQHYAYLVQQMRALARDHRTNVDSNLGRFIDSLEADEMEGLADYVTRLRGATKDRTKLGNSGVAGD